MGYTAASIVALGVDVATMALLVKHFAWGYLGAATASFLTGLVVTYVASTQWIFSQRRFDDARAEFLSYVAVGVSGLAINSAVIYISVEYFGFLYVAAKLMAAIFTFCCNYMARRRLFFSRPSRT